MTRSSITLIKIARVSVAAIRVMHLVPRHKYRVQIFSFLSAKRLQAGFGPADRDFHVVEFQVGIAECVEWLGDELVLRCHERGIHCRRFRRSDRSRVWIGFSDAMIADQFRNSAPNFGF